MSEELTNAQIERQEANFDFHFSVGNSTDGPVGMCARVFAETPEAAVELLQERINNLHLHEVQVRGIPDYIAFYLNPDAITIHHIDEWDDEQGETYYREDQLVVGDYVMASVPGSFNGQIIAIDEEGIHIEDNFGSEIVMPAGEVWLSDEEDEPEEV